MDSRNRKLRNIMLVTTALLIGLFLFLEFKPKLFKPKPSTPIVNPGGNSGNEANQVEKGDKYAVSTSNPIATEVGMKVLESGGNAADAAVAISFALNVVDPQNSGIGGGGGMLIYDRLQEEKDFYDYYISSGDAEPNQYIGIPGFLKGMDLINKEKGTKPLAELISYAIDIAEQGIPVTEGYSRILNAYPYIAEVYPAFNKDGMVLQEGDILYQPELVDSLKQIQEHGVDIFYNGESQMSQNFLEVSGYSLDSLKNYKVIKSKPIESDYRGFTVTTAPAPFSGLTLLQSLDLEEYINLPKHELSDTNYTNNLYDLFKFTAAEGRKYIGDPQFNPVNYESVLEESGLIDRFIDSIDRPDTEYEDPEAESTTAFNVIDKNGMVVSGTNTISNYWGSYVVRDGIIYNNAMKNFTGGVNKFEYNKRPKTGIAPTITSHEKGYVEALSSNGGAKIPQYLFNYLVNTKKYDVPLQDANDLERIYYFKSKMIFESNAPLSTHNNIVLDHDYAQLDSSTAWGIMNSVQINSKGVLDGHSDKRNYFDGGVSYFDGENRIDK